MSVERVREEVARTARMIAAAGLVEAFGHVSARLPDGVAITSTRPMDAARAQDVVLLDASGEAVGGALDDVPLEIRLHLEIYAARPDVMAICRGHSPAAVAWGASDADLPALHGLGLLAGRRVRVHDDIALISDLRRGRAAAERLGPDSALLLRANGGLAVGATLTEAATRLYALEERARVALAPTPPAARPVTEAEWDAREPDSAVELVRACRWFAHRFRTRTDDQN
ncbi:class II aldolase/adducin family protein [Actinocorallia sp. B10E7]|uniref:class II aldolase/adducin family protein n=1 Tax=Actinocorallia sp. B10E7 TaxID=3153558 RepID=UPI00325F1B96